MLVGHCGVERRRRPLTLTPKPKNASTNGSRLFCSVVSAISFPVLMKGPFRRACAVAAAAAAASSRLPRLVCVPLPPPSFLSGWRSASTLKLTAYVLLNELLRTKAPAPGCVGVFIRDPGRFEVKRGAAVLGRGEGAAVEARGGSSGGMRTSRRTCTATASAATTFGSVDVGSLRTRVVCSRTARSQSERTGALSVENMYLRLTSKWFVNETCAHERSAQAGRCGEACDGSYLERMLHERAFDRERLGERQALVSWSVGADLDEHHRTHAQGRSRYSERLSV